MLIRKTCDLQPDLLDLLRSLDLEYQYAYTIQEDKNPPRSISIVIECVAISLADLESLLPWGGFIVCPCNDVNLELYTSLPAEIEKCTI